MLTALKGSQFYFYLLLLQLVLCRAAALKKSPGTSFIVQITFSFWSFEISGGIPRNQKIIKGLDSFTKQHLLFWPHFDFASLCNDYPIKCCKIAVILFGSMLPH